jgi:hypothetical protein
MVFFIHDPAADQDILEQRVQLSERHTMPDYNPAELVAAAAAAEEIQ